MSLRRYTSADEDSARWDGFMFRDGDIVVSARSKHGTTWVQTILLLLIHQRAHLPAPLAQLSPWLDHLIEPRDLVLARLAAQRHRRVIKTHTPLDGVPRDSQVTHVVVARHPLDAAVSLYHQGDNLDRERMSQLTGAPKRSRSSARPPVRAWLSTWIGRDADPARELDSLPGVLWHLSDAWARRGEDNVVLIHYDDLRANLKGQMQRLGDLLGIAAPHAGLDDLVEAATLDGMRAQAERLAPDPVGILRDRRAFFRQGRSGGGAELLDHEQLTRYHDRATALGPPGLLHWLHR